MKYIPRKLRKELLKAARSFAAVLLTGPRQSGKTTLLKRCFPGADYILLEDPDVIARVTADPRGFLDAVKRPVILDEIQNTPQLLSYIRTLIDDQPGKKGQWLLSGSQEAPLMQGVSESMAGRTAIMQLYPLSLEESEKVSVLRGGFPDVLAKPAVADIWFRSYVQTYLERDVRSMAAIKNLSTFRRFIALLASRHGGLLNKTDLAAPIGVSVPTITAWLGILEATGQLLLIPPFYENFGKRLVKSPKIYFADSGLACHLLGIQSKAELSRSPFAGILFEGFVASEIVKQQINSGKRKELYYFRDRQGMEVDFLVPLKAGEIALLEVKSTKTPLPAMANVLRKLERNIKSFECKRLVVHDGKPGLSTATLGPGTRAVTPGELLKILR